MRNACLLVHALLILLASTSITIVKFATSGDRLQWRPFEFVYKNGFGYTYQSDFTLPLIATYLLAFLSGLVGFVWAYRQGRRVVGAAGGIMSVIGLTSFAIECSHLFVEHNLSWRAFSPAVMLLLVVLALIPWKPGTPSGTL